ncbi:MAG: hypothetical protein A2Z43_08365 [Syntrophobacterales bacterium RBG_19FT_COMBO_59_10]|nr:MAG: hypothetical protein A2Z43_08365 [Syntrophobacterales bacterium RBG_19FT_COMBO_59_10]
MAQQTETDQNPHGYFLFVAIRQSLIFSKGSFMIFVTRLITATRLAAALLLLIPHIRGRRPGSKLSRTPDRESEHSGEAMAD